MLIRREKMNQDFIDFYNRWLEKARLYNTDDLSDCFDKFVTLFILFNSQYNYLADEDANKLRDQQKATNFIKQFINSKEFCEIKTVADSSHAIIKLIDVGVFYLKNETIDNEIVGKMRSSDYNEKVEGILEAIYKVRCNLFHGDKSFVPQQKLILLPCIAILEEINKIVFESIKKKSEAYNLNQ